MLHGLLKQLMLIIIYLYNVRDNEKPVEIAEEYFISYLHSSPPSFISFVPNIYYVVCSEIFFLLSLVNILLF
jgi:hypothetical protein